MTHGKAALPEGAAAARYSLARWGIQTRLIPRQTVSVGTTATRIALNNPRRMNLKVVNVGTGFVYVGFDSSVAAATDIPLSPTGGLLELVIDDDGELLTNEVWGIAPAGAQNVALFELVEQ